MIFAVILSNDFRCGHGRYRDTPRKSTAISNPFDPITKVNDGVKNLSTNTCIYPPLQGPLPAGSHEVPVPPYHTGLPSNTHHRNEEILRTLNVDEVLSNNLGYLRPSLHNRKIVSNHRCLATSDHYFQGILQQTVSARPSGGDHIP